MDERKEDNVRVVAVELDELTSSSPSEPRQNQRTSLASITFTDNAYAHKQRSPTVRRLLFLLDLTLTCSPCLFLGITFAAISFNGKMQDKQNLVTTFDPSLGQYVQQQATGIQALLTTRSGNTVIAAAKIAVSIFPIVFAAIVGRFLKSYAMHRAEKGAPMGTLEQFYGSQSLSNAVQLTYALRGPGLLGIGVVVLWLLSPLGGQATQRVLEKTTTFNSSSGNVFYTNTSATNSIFGNHFLLAGSIDNIYAALSAVMLSDRIAQDNDIWGNVKVPYFETLDTTGHDPASITNGSTTLAIYSSSTSSSMAGLLINNVTHLSNTKFTVKTSYMTLTCEAPRTWNYSAINDAFVNNTEPTHQQLQPYYDFLTWANLLDNLANGTNSNTSFTSDGNYDHFWNSWSFNIGVQTNGTTNLLGVDTPTFANPPTFVYAAQSEQVITAFKCASKVVWVESDVLCKTDGICGIYGMRNSTRPKAALFDPIFDQSFNDGGHGFPLSQMLGRLNTYSSVGAVGVVNPIQRYVAQDIGIITPTTGAGDPDYSQVRPSSLEWRLATLLNTFWMLGLQGAAIYEPRSTNITQILASENNSTTYDPDFSSNLGYDVIGAYATFTSSNDIYTVNWPFAIICMITSLMLLFLGFLGIYYRRTNVHPDVLGYVSTLTRDNPLFEAPLDAHKSDGLEMANYYKSMRVQLVSTANEKDSGRITLRPLHRGV